MDYIEIGLVTSEMDDTRPRYIKWPAHLRIPMSGDYWSEPGKDEYIVADVQWRYQESRPLAPMSAVPVLYLTENTENDCDCDECN